ncbi:MAG: hemerythrin domain-containing protein [Rhizobiaceae bacterium]|nr:hemerythrin domain-containing protein [Rhizobiaceae bacterium]
MSELKLEMRPGLPDSLRVLLQEYPRDAWQSNDRFHGLISFWLDRHLMFRQVLAKMSDLTEQAQQRNIEHRIYASQLSRYARFFVEQLHGHHHMEDEHYFPTLMDLDSRLQRGFAILDSDHHELDGQLHGFTDAANGVIMPQDPADAVGDTARFLGVLSRFEVFLNRHLVDEEELIVPIILKYDSADLN